MSRRHDAYERFAGHYDLHGWDWFAAVHGEKLIRLLKDRGVASGRILDAGCGTGSLALLLAASGYQVAGFDLSETMLAAARRKDEAGTVTWSQADVTRLDLLGKETPFDVITCVADTLNHLEDLSEWEAAFRRFHAHLKPGGTLFFDVMTCRGLANLDKFGVFENAGTTLLLSIIYEADGRRSTVKVTSFIPSNTENLYEKATETITEHGQPVAGILARLAAAGFEKIEHPWSDAADPEMEDRLIVLASKA